MTSLFMPDMPAAPPPPAPPPPMAPPVNPAGPKKPKRQAGLTPPSLIGGDSSNLGGAVQGTYQGKTLLGQA